MTRRATLRFLPVLLIGFAILHAAPPAANAGKAGMEPELLARVPARMKAFVEKVAFQNLDDLRLIVDDQNLLLMIGAVVKAHQTGS